MNMLGILRPSSLQARLSLWLAVGMSVLWLAAAVGAGFFLRSEIDEVFDSALQEVAQRVMPLAYTEILNTAQILPSASQRLAAVSAHKEYLTYVVRDGSGNLLLQSHDADPAIFTADLKPGFHDTPQYRFYNESAVSGTLVVTVAEPLKQRNEAVYDAVVALVWPLAGLLPVSLIGIWWLVRRTMKPVVAFHKAIESRGRGDLSSVETAFLPSEISPVAIAVNDLMLRLRRALESERSFTANSAHELRTPIAATLAQTQRLIAEAGPGPVKDRAVRIEGSLHQLARLSEKLLQLAKAEGGGLLSEKAEDLAPILEFVIDDFRRHTVPEDRLVVRMPTGKTAYSPMNADAFAILARNLIENALKHGAQDQPVLVSLDDDATLRVVNGGAVLDNALLQKLRRPFERGPGEVEGSGLGLAIADAIASGTQAHLDLQSPASGRKDGFEAILHPPVQARGHP